MAKDRVPPRARWLLLGQLTRLLEGPLVILAFIWLGLLLIDLAVGLSGRLVLVRCAVWVVCLVDFSIRLRIAPRRLVCLRRNWLTALSLILPALRVVRAVRALQILRAAWAVRSLTLRRLVTTLHRSIAALGSTLRQRGLGFVLAATAVVLVAGAAGFAYFESPPAVAEAGGRAGIGTYADALWYSAMLLTTLGSEYWPQTAEGRMLTWLMAIYAFAVFGYITASFASHFVRIDQPLAAGVNSSDRRPAGLERELALLRSELALLRSELAGRSAADAGAGAQPSTGPRHAAPSGGADA